jgi:hypothetical protein
MGSSNKIFTFFLIILLVVLPLQFVKPVLSLTRPSTPEFSVQFTGPSFNISTITYYSNETGYTQYNGTGQYWTVDHNTLEITIKNQPFSPEVLNGETTELLYFVQSKTHSSQNWTTWYSLSDQLPQQSNSDYTILTYAWNGGFVYNQGIGIPMPNDTQVDIQVQAGNGYNGREIVDGRAPWIFYGVTSDWSNQTITTGTVKPNYTNISGESPSPILPSQLVSVIITISVILVTATILILIYNRHRKKRL